MFPVTRESLEALAQCGYSAYAVELAEQHTIPLPEPLTFDCSLEKFKAQMPELERQLR
jgi:hypothetical protein